ncbi:HPP family protein [Marinomonas rhizomae]|uniref:HPP family protein n=1 Tax=Marinomonas rhizomae TaxID=491948 RepID=A0A366JAE0_9GAMM|nr:HPP family protein [Marinomonas rhizomae]RBP83922.1 HPP family protein [Marinomonas rhizomae]RNF73374.1 HPP family protein [Marinomonas rhizomae]
MLSNFFTSFYQSRFFPICLAGAGATLCIFMIAQGAQLAPEYLGIMAPFGATMVILFALPQSPLAQPKNILVGHLLTTTIGLISLQFWEVTPVSMAVSVGLGVALMMLTNTLHPPAGANPLLVISINASWGFLLSPVLSGCLLIILFGWFYHNWVSRIGYPIKPSK